VQLKRAVVVASIVAIVIAALGAATASAAKPTYTAFGSCGASKPPSAAEHCGFDGSEHARATIVWRSNVGKRALKVCQRISGLSFHGRQCLKATKPTASESIPFALKGAYRSFRLVVTFYAKVPGSDGPYKQAGRVALKFSP
jgi:hypothetical protein